jgi:mRNA-degrading endonuclease RelE of RelBE toxin-antitoxin system
VKGWDGPPVPRSHNPGIRERVPKELTKGNPVLLTALDESLAILREDPHNRSGQHGIKKLAGLKPGEGQWRLRWRDYRVRYDIFGEEVVLHSFRHRKEAY